MDSKLFLKCMDKIGPIIYHSPSLTRIILNLFIKMATPTRLLQEGYCVPPTYTVCPRYNAPRYNADSGITRSTVAPEN